MVTNNLFRSDLPGLYNITQNAMVLYPKELVIATLRDFFSRDSWYSYRRDVFGFPQTVDETNLPLTAGLHDNVTTRLLITERWRFDTIFYPCLLVYHGGSTSVPISFNRETSTVQYGDMVFEDGYGNIKTFKTPTSFIFAGSWEGSINIDIRARDLRARDDLVDLTSLLFVDIAFNDLVKSGLIIKGVSAGTPTETTDRNDQVFQQTVTLQVKSEWRRTIPIGNIIDMINFGIEFQQLGPVEGPVAENLTITSQETLTELLAKL